MKFRLTLETLDRNPELELYEDEFKQIRDARDILSNALRIEEKYDLLIGNYLELERELVKRAADAMVRMEIEYQAAYEVQSTLNLRLVNLLSSARLYLDHLRSHISAFPGARESFNTIAAEQYDACFEYRFMEALRNFVQHQGLPIHWLQFNHSSEVNSVDRSHFTSIEIAFRKSDLPPDHEFKSSVFKECPDVVDLKYAAREYITRLGRLHDFVRKTISVSIQNSRVVYQSAIDAYSKSGAETVVGLTAQKLVDGIVVERVPVFLNWDDVRKKLASRNPSIRQLATAFVTSKCQPR